ncbi:hypothetical protein GGE67_000841 [Rhizobium leucaenae]|nr:hypothetical protein [Rhizobium leucaenae]
MKSLTAKIEYWISDLIQHPKEPNCRVISMLTMGFLRPIVSCAAILIAITSL